MVEPGRRPGPPTGRGNFWQALAIVALIAATAGWTTVVVLALHDTSTAALANPSDSFDPNASADSSVPPVADSHDAPELEVLLPTDLSGTALQIQSVTGDGLLTADEWSTSITSFLTSVHKLPADLLYAQASDPVGALDALVSVYRVAGVEATTVRDALIQAWKSGSPDLKVSQVTLDGKAVTKADFGADTAASYMYTRDDLVFDIETTDVKIATAALAALPVPGASASPGTSTTPTASNAPAASGSAAP